MHAVQLAQESGLGNQCHANRRMGDITVVIVVYSACFLFAFGVTRAYRQFRKHYASVLFVSGISVLYTLICRGYLLWYFPKWFVFGDKAFNLIHALFLFPATTVLFLHYFRGSKRRRFVCFVIFMAIYTIYEILLMKTGGIVYQHGWSFGWSIFIDFTMFVLIPLNCRWPLTALISATGVTVLLLLWFRVPIFVLD